jgi:hypothetical protein
MKQCSIPGCGKPVHAKDLCNPHYRHSLKYGGPLAGPPLRVLYNGAKCGVDGCDNPAHSKGLCSRHYGKQRVNGDPLGGRETRQGEPGEWLRANKDHAGAECLIYPFSRNGGGYGASREMCRLAHGEPPTSEHQAAHSCGRGHEGCVNPMHLSWKLSGGPGGNVADKLIHGTHQFGERNPFAELKHSDIGPILDRLAAGEAQTAIAADYGVEQSNISAINRGKTWYGAVAGWDKADFDKWLADHLMKAIEDEAQS